MDNLTNKKIFQYLMLKFEYRGGIMHANDLFCTAAFSLKEKSKNYISNNARRPDF